MAITECTRLDVLEDGGKLRRSVLKRKRVISVVVSDLLNLIVEVAEHEALVLSGIFGNLNIGAVDSTEEQGTTRCQFRPTLADPDTHFNASFMLLWDISYISDM